MVDPAATAGTVVDMAAHDLAPLLARLSTEVGPHVITHTDDGWELAALEATGEFEGIGIIVGSVDGDEPTELCAPVVERRPLVHAGSVDELVTATYRWLEQR